MSSQTVFGTIKTAWDLRPIGKASVLLLLVWVLSPFGGQAILRSMQIVVASGEALVALKYMSLDPRISTQFDTYHPTMPYDEPEKPRVAQLLFGTALLSTAGSLHDLNGTAQQAIFEKLVSNLGGAGAAIGFSRRDMWNHARIPIVDLLPDFDEEAFNRDQWFDIPNDQVLSYSSAFGIPLFYQPPKQTGSASFTIQSAYTRFKVSAHMYYLSLPLLTFLLKCAEKWMMGPKFKTHLNHANSTFLPVEGESNSGNLTHKFEAISFDNATENLAVSDRPCDTKERQFLFHIDQRTAWDVDHNSYGLICYPRTVYVEVDITCIRATEAGQLQCDARRIRRSQETAHHCPGITEIDYIWDSDRYNPLNHMMSLQWYSSNSPDPPLAEQFLLNPPGVFKNFTMVERLDSHLTYYNLTSVAPKQLANRLTMLWNTWSMATKDNGLISGFEYSSFGGQSPQGVSLLANESTAMWKYETGNIYHIHRGWVGVYLGSVFFLYICCLLGALIRYQLDIPEILGSMSSLTRDSIFVRLPDSAAASSLTGDERTILLKNVGVQMKDVKGDEEVGRLAITLCENNKERVPLVPGRLYE